MILDITDIYKNSFLNTYTNENCKKKISFKVLAECEGVHKLL